jgi:tetratricopeptide (TPR) repeat protein
MDAPQQAIAALEKIARQNPRLPIVHTLLALAYQRLDDDGSAVDELKRAIELSPRDGRTLYYLGELYIRRRRTAQAQECFQRAVELNPLLEDAYLRLGDWAIEERDLPTAQARFQIAVALSPDSLAPRAKLALAMQLQGNLAGAEKELRELLKRDPDNQELKLRMEQLFLERNRSLTTREKGISAR